ncbi:MAG: hypothetical protein P4L56_22955 [Candidatus Sulfopaludibacter sp.]|nr:hypothetical protein [Candidatus Sulfopaludibacter sp.]
MTGTLPFAPNRTTRRAERRSRSRKLEPSVVAVALARTITEVQEIVRAIEENDPAMAFAEVVLGGKGMLAEDLLAEMLTNLKLRGKLGVTPEEYFMHGEESLAIRKTARDLTAERRPGSLHDAVDGTDLRVLNFGNDCSAAIVVDPTESPGARILTAAIGLPGKAVYYSIRDSDDVLCWRIKGHQLCTSGPSIASKRIAPPSRLADAIVCCYGQKPASLAALIGTGFFDRWLAQPNPLGRFHTLAGMPMVPKLVAPMPGTRPVDVILEIAGQAAHDMAPGAYIALNGGATILHLDGRPFRVEEIEEAALHPANEQFRMRYVMAASQTLAEEAVDWLRTPIKLAKVS